jgi:hypothetical protein
MKDAALQETAFSVRSERRGNANGNHRADIGSTGDRRHCTAKKRSFGYSYGSRRTCRGTDKELFPTCARIILNLLSVQLIRQD